MRNCMPLRKFLLYAAGFLSVGIVTLPAADIEGIAAGLLVITKVTLTGFQLRSAK